MKNFLQRNIWFVTAAAVLGVVGGAFCLHHVASFMQQEKLPGLKHEISLRSGHEIQTVLSKTAHVTSAFVVRHEFEERQTPFVWYWARVEHQAVVAELMIALGKQIKMSGKSSDDYEELAKLNPSMWSNEVQNSEAAKNGIIVCAPLETNELARQPVLRKFSKGLCYATIPPFQKETYLAILVLLDIPGDDSDKRVRDVRASLVKLQLDIFNRDFKGTETWPHP